MDFWKKPLAVQKSKICKNIKEYDSIDDMLNIEETYKSFDMYNTAFCINILDMMGIKTVEEDHILFDGGLRGLRGGLKKDEGRLSRLEFALETGAGAIEEFTNGQRSLSSDSGPCVQLEGGELKPLSVYRNLSRTNLGDGKSSQEIFEFESQNEASQIIKKAVMMYGADLVGIAPFDERWLYNTEVFVPQDHVTGKIISDQVDIKRKVKFDFVPKSVIVMAFEMDKEAYATQPSNLGGAATTIGYSRMIESSLKLSYFLQSLGYKAQHSGNDIGLSVPTAIQAGLGESSRMGLLITPAYGARVRLAKVYTDLELEVDKPISFGVKEICENCKLCSKVCPSGAISSVSKITDPSNNPRNCSNGTGVEKWYTDGQKCLAFWGDNNTECGVCIANCVFSK